MGIIVGVDEVGRGCWAGPVVAAAVILKQPVSGLKDSKLLTRTQRERLALDIQANALYGVGWASHEEVDRFGLTFAVGKAMAAAMAGITVDYDEIIIDGNYNFLTDKPAVRTLVGADMTITAVSAASIIAKVARDAYMVEQARLFPRYGFETNVGYGTASHRLALKSYGVTKIHRLSYKPVKAFLR